MQPYKIRQLRADSTVAYVYNSGALMFLYDDASGEAIREASPSLTQGYYGDPDKDVDAALVALGEQGHLVVFEIYQDDEFVGEVSVGPPIGAGEAGGLPFSEPVRALLSLPSGALAIESFDSLRVGGEEPTDPGAIVTVPPGTYVVSLQCLSPEYEQDRDDLVAEYVITLEPLGAGDAAPANRPLLAYPWR